jgi:hypothetical protein
MKSPSFSRPSERLSGTLLVGPDTAGGGVGRPDNELSRSRRRAWMAPLTACSPASRSIRLWSGRKREPRLLVHRWIPRGKRIVLRVGYVSAVTPASWASVSARYRKRTGSAKPPKSNQTCPPSCSVPGDDWAKATRLRCRAAASTARSAASPPSSMSRATARAEPAVLMRQTARVTSPRK